MIPIEDDRPKDYLKYLRPRYNKSPIPENDYRTPLKKPYAIIRYDPQRHH